MSDLVLMTGTAHPGMASLISAHLNRPLLDVHVNRFSDGEIDIKIMENIRGTDVFIVQPTMPPADNIMELLLLIDAVKRASCRRVTAVIPYFGYARQDRKDQPRVPIGARLVANLITVAGADRVLTLDLHAPQIQGFFDIPMDHLYSAPVLLKHFENWPREKIAVLSPDVGSIKMARSFAKRLEAPLAIVDKRRPQANQAEVMHFIGEVSGRDVIIFDDMIDTAGTITQAAESAMEQGALSVTSCATHPIFSGESLQRLTDSSIKNVVVSNTIPFVRHSECPIVEVLDVSGLLAEAIDRINLEKSVSTLFL